MIGTTHSSLFSFLLGQCIMYFYFCLFLCASIRILKQGLLEVKACLRIFYKSKLIKVSPARLQNRAGETFFTDAGFNLMTLPSGAVSFFICVNIKAS